MVPIIVPTHPPPSLSPLTLAPTPPILPSLDTSIRSITYFLRNHATTTTPLSTIITELNSISRHETNLSNFMDVTPYTRDDCSLLSPHYAPPPPTQPHLLPCRGGGVEEKSQAIAIVMVMSTGKLIIKLMEKGTAKE